MLLAERLLDIVVTAIVGLPLQQFVLDVSEQVNYSFIDEIFHYPQFQTLLGGDYTTWNPKITTPPGLYYLTASYCKIFNLEGSLSDIRYFNYIGGILIGICAILIRNKIKNPGFASGIILLNPLLSLFYSLYYTDVWSSFFIIAALTVIIWKPKGFVFTSVISSIICLISLTFRQTNIAWSLFLMIYLIDMRIKEDKQDDSDVITFFKTSIKNFGILVPYAIVGALFMTFVYLNGGIALGDKENHILVPHLAQVCYCVTFLTVFSMPIWISIGTIFEYLTVNFLTLSGLIFNAAWIPILFMMIQGFTIIHPFILADNRHYVFYIVRNFIVRTETSRYELLPVYHFSFYIVYRLLKNRGMIVFYAFMGCMSISVMLSPLFEPRYYILPYIIFRLLAKPIEIPLLNLSVLHKHNTSIRYVGEILWLWFWTQALYIVFLQFTFSWDTEAELQRIIW